MQEIKAQSIMMQLSMIDRTDITTSTLALVMFKALKTYGDLQLVKWLEDPDPLVRHAVATELHLRPSESNFQSIALLSKSERYEHREVCALTLGQFGTPSCEFAERSFGILFDFLRDPYFEVRCAAINAVGTLASLGKNPPDILTEAVLDLAGDARTEIRTVIGYALLSLSGDEVDRTLERLSADGQAEVRDAAEFSTEARRKE